MQASVAKLETSVSLYGDKLELKVYGFSDKLPVLLSKVLAMTKSFLPRDDRFMVYANALKMLLLIYVFFNFACSFAWILCFSSFIVAVLWEYGGQKYKGMWQKSFPEIHFNYWIFASLFTHQKQNEMMFFFCVGIVEGRKCGNVSISSILYSWVVKGWLFDDPRLFHF